MPAEPPPVAVIGGTGALGFGLALRLTQAGVPVTIGSRSAERAQQAVERAREALAADAPTLDGAENAAAAEGREIVFCCVPFASQAENIRGLDTLREGQILVDATVPLATAVGGRPIRTLGVPQGSAAQQAAELVPDGVSVVAALHTVNAPALGDPAATLDEDVLVCGDRRADKRKVAALIDRIPGLRCVDAGRLEMARIAEQLTALLISVNGRYKTHAGIRLTALPDDLWPAPAPK